MEIPGSVRYTMWGQSRRDEVQGETKNRKESREMDNQLPLWAVPLFFIGISLFFVLIYCVNGLSWKNLSRHYPAVSPSPQATWHSSLAWLGSGRGRDAMIAHFACDEFGLHAFISGVGSHSLSIPWPEISEVRGQPGLLGTGRTWFYGPGLDEPLVLNVPLHRLDTQIPADIR